MPDNAPEPTDEATRLLGEIAGFEEDMRRCQAKIRHLMESEDIAKGLYFPKEIFEVRQDKLRLEVEIQFRRVALNRLRQEA